MEKQFYFLNSDLGESRTGIENSSLMRARMFSKHLGLDPIIATASYNPRLNLQRKKLYETGLLYRTNKIINLYEYLQETITNPILQHTEEWRLNNKWHYHPVKDTKDYRITDELDKLLIYRKCDDDGRLMYNNVCINQKKVRRDTYDSNGYLSRVQYLDPVDGHAHCEAFYRIDGSICMYKYYQKKDEKNNLTGIHLISKTGQLIDVFASEQELITYWLNLLIDENQENFFVIDKERVFYPSVVDMSHPNLFKICMIHSSHLQNGEDILNGKLNGNYRRIFEDLSKIDAMVVLTNRQKEHIEKRFGPKDHIHVIHHAIENEVSKVDFQSRKPLQAIYLARYSSEKQHASLIRVFEKVVRKFPSAKLQCYGHGSLKADFIRQIKELNLQDNVFMNDFTDQLDEIYNSAGLSVLPSKVEGFSLFLLESIAHGCPVISYDIEYSPSDMIEDGRNGYLIERNNEDAMADKIISLFSDQEMQMRMSDASYQKAEEFLAKNVVSKWEDLIAQALSSEPVYS